LLTQFGVRLPIPKTKKKKKKKKKGGGEGGERQGNREVL